MTARDIYRFINEQDDNTIERIIDRLEFRGKDPTFKGWLEAYLDKLQLAPSAHVLMLGCGTGVEVRVLAGRSDFTGTVVGIDISPELLEAAKKFAADEDIGERVEFQIGDAQRLGYADDSFDAVIRAHSCRSCEKTQLKKTLIYTSNMISADVTESDSHLEVTLNLRLPHSFCQSFFTVLSAGLSVLPC